MVFRLLENAFVNQNIGEGLKKDCAEGSNTPCFCQHFFDNVATIKYRTNTKINS